MSRSAGSTAKGVSQLRFGPMARGGFLSGFNCGSEVGGQLLFVSIPGEYVVVERLFEVGGFARLALAFELRMRGKILKD